MTPAQRGAALLDRTHPGWYERIDLDRLNIASPGDCVVGQLYGGVAGAFTEGLLHLEIIGGQADYGFAAFGPSDVDDQMASLTNEWRQLIHTRLNAQN